MGAEMYIYIMKSVFLQLTWWSKCCNKCFYGAVISVCGHHVCSFSRKHNCDYKWDLDFFYNNSINVKLIKRLAFSTPYCLFLLYNRQQKSYQTQSQHCFASLSNMMVFCSWMNQPFTRFASITKTQLTMICCHILVVLIPHFDCCFPVFFTF